MAKFDVYKNPEGEGFLLDIQTDLLSELNTRIVVPLIPLEMAPKPADTLNPVFDIDGSTVSMVTQFMAAVPAKLLRTKLPSLVDRRNQITAAVDFLIQGF